MITYEESLKKAKAWKTNIDCCTEYEHAYVFGCKDDENYEGGYGHTPVVIYKETGERSAMKKQQWRSLWIIYKLFCLH